MTWGIMLDSGAILGRHYANRGAARKALVDHNAKARAGKARGDMVTLRIAIGIAKVKPKSIQSMGGRARAAKLSPNRRSEIAREAARKRWGAKP